MERSKGSSKIDNMNIIQSPSKNFYNGRFGYKPELIVVHCTDGSYPSDLAWLRGTSNPPVSSSYYIAPDGATHQLVDDANGAWHAGRVLNPTASMVASRPGINPNYYSLGIEVSLRPPAIAGAAQYEALKDLIRHLANKHNISIDRQHIVGHKEIFSGKTCPGTIDVTKLVADLSAAPVPVPPSNMVDKEEFKKKIITYIQSL